MCIIENRLIAYAVLHALLLHHAFAQNKIQFIIFMFSTPGAPGDPPATRATLPPNFRLPEAFVWGGVGWGGGGKLKSKCARLPDTAG